MDRDEHLHIFGATGHGLNRGESNLSVQCVFSFVVLLLHKICRHSVVSPAPLTPSPHIKTLLYPRLLQELTFYHILLLGQQSTVKIFSCGHFT